MPRIQPRPLTPPVRQERSRRSAERIVAAALELLETRTFDELSVHQIASEAGLSVGGFYARFTDKAELLGYLNASVLDALVEKVRVEFSPAATAGLPARSIIERYITLAVRSFRKHKRVLMQVALRSRTSPDPAFRARIREANRVLHDSFRAALETCDDVRHPTPKLAVDVALTAVSGAMREYVLFQDHRPHFESIGDARLIAELTDLFCQYLRCSPGAQR